MPETSDYRRVAKGDDDEAMVRFGERLRSARLRLNLQQAEVGELVGADVGSISRWERGKGYPQAQQLVKLANALGESLDHLLLGAPGEGPTSMPRALAEFLQTPSGRRAQARAYVPTLMSVVLPGEPSVAFYRALLAALETADDD